MTVLNRFRAWLRRLFHREPNICTECGIEITWDYYPCGCYLRMLREDAERKDIIGRLNEWSEAERARRA